MNLFKLLFITVLCLAFNITLNAQHDHSGHQHHSKDVSKEVKEGMTDIFMVYGNCGMCENRIESALMNVGGINSADWDVDTKVMTVIYDDDIISLDKIKEKVALAGHDTDKFRAKNEIYNGLPGCCQYDRPEEISK